MKKYISMLLTVFMLILNGPVSAYAAWQYSAVVTGSDFSSFGRAVDLVRTSDGDFLAVADNTNTYIYKRNESTDNWDLKDTISTAALSISMTDDRIAFSDNSSNVYVYTRDNAEGTSWTQQASFSGAGGFGYGVHSVDLEGDLLVVGSFVDDTDGSWAGAATVYYYYDPPTPPPLYWYQVAFLHRDTICTAVTCDNDEFGKAVSIQGDNVLVGAQNHSYYYNGSSYVDCAGGSGSTCGAAYIYRTTDGGVTWENGGNDPSLELYPVEAGTGPAYNDQFGYAVSMEDDYLAITSEWGGPAPQDGTVTVFERSGSDWVSPEEFQHSDPQGSGGGDHFGAAVDMEGDYMMVGAPEWGGQQGGKIYVFELSGGSWDNQIFTYQEPGGPYWGINLGTDVAMDGNDYYAAAGNTKDTAPDTKIFYNDTGGGPGAVPEFSDYMYILTIIIAFGLMVRIVPKTGFSLQSK